MENFKEFKIKPYQHFYLSKMQNVAIMQSETKHPSLSDSVVELYEQGGILCFQKASFNNNYTEKENGTRCYDHGCLVNKKWFKGL